MVKEATMLRTTSPRDTSVREPKKRKKAPNSTPPIPPKIPKGDVYTEVVEFEEKEALRRSPEKDVALFHDTCTEIGRMMVEILVLKQKKTEQAAADINEKRISVSLLFVTLKKLNRLEKVRLKQARDTTNEMKQKVDNFHLQLQNLLYEVMHLQKEVTKCQEFKSKDEEIDLVHVEEFYKTAPEKISRPMVTKKDPHQLKLARLEWELEQRKQLAVKCKKLEESKESVAKAIREKQDYLENLAPRLSTILEDTKPLQEYLEMPLDKNRVQHTMAQHLPLVLYTLFVQGSAYKDACDKSLDVSVEGDLEEAKAGQQNLMDQTEADGEGEESDSEQEADTGEEGTRKRQKRRHRKKSQMDRAEEKRKRLLAKHPLWVQFIIKMKDGSSITLNFYYLVNLHIVTMKCEINLAQPVHEINTGALLSPESILCCLFPHDSGQESPNAANAFQLQRVGITHLREHMDDTGVPYIWAQRVGGMDFLRADPVEAFSSQMDDDLEAEAGEEKGQRVATSFRPDIGLSRNHLEGVVRAVRRRLAARVALAKQMEAFEKGSLLPPPAHLTHLFPTKISSSLSSWRCIPWEDLPLRARQLAMDSGMVSLNSSSYAAVVERGKAKMTLSVAVRADYPRAAPVFALQLHWDGVDRDGSSYDALRDMEKEVNVYWKEMEGARDQLLICQMHRILSCLDIYVESEGVITSTERQPEFPKEKIFFKAVRGRNRSRPFKFLSAGGGIFTQR